MRSIMNIIWQILWLSWVFSAIQLNLPLMWVIALLMVITLMAEEIVTLKNK